MQQAGFGAVLRVREARTLLWAALVSGVGDQVARVALSVAVLDRTGSVLLGALVIAVSYAPWVLFGPLLAGLADRLPARRVLVGSDLARAGLVALMVLPGLPVWALLLLLFLTELAAPPFDAARSALLPEVLEDDAYVAGTAMLGALQQATLVGGVGLAGVLLTVVGPAEALALDAATFLVSALLLRRGLRPRPAAAPTGRVSPWADVLDGVRALQAQPGVRRLVLGAWLATAVAVLPEGLAVAYGRQHGADGWATAALLTAEPTGAVVFGLLVSRLVPPDRRPALAWPLLLGGSLPLLGMLVDPGMLGAGLLLGLCGLSGAGVLLVSTRVGRSVPPEVRGRVFGIAASGLMAAQGLALLAGGVLSEVLPLHHVMALAGLAGLLGLAVLTLRDGLLDRPAADAAVPERASEEASPEAALLG